MENKIVVSRHALDRMRERSGLNKKSVQKVAERAYEKGIKHSDVHGDLYRYISGVAGRSSRGADIRLYGDKAFIFNKNRLSDNRVKLIDKYILLVTVIQLPPNLVKKLQYVKDSKDNTYN